MSKSVKKKGSKKVDPDKKVTAPDPDPGSKVVEESPKPVKPDSPTKRLISYLSELIEAGKYTRKDLIQMGVEKIPELKPISIATILTDSKNPKYNKFPMLVHEKEGGILGFVDSK